MSIEAMKQALEALEIGWSHTYVNGIDAREKGMKAITSLRKAIAETEKQEPVAWLITDEAINSIQVASIQRLIDRLKHAHHTDLFVRLNGKDEWFQADWIKHLKRANPQPKRESLTDEQIYSMVADITDVRSPYIQFARAIEAAHGIIKNYPEKDKT